MFKIYTAAFCTSLLLCGSAYAQADSHQNKPASILKSGTQDDTPQAPSGLNSSAMKKVSPAGGNHSMNPNAGAAGMENDMDAMRQKVATQDAMTAAKKSGSGIKADKPDDALSKSGSEEFGKIKEQRDKAAQAKQAKLAGCTLQCNKSNPVDDAINNALNNGGSKFGSGIGSAMQTAKEEKMKEGNSPSENKMMEEAKANAQAVKEEKAKAEAAKKEQARKECIKQCVDGNTGK